MSFRCFVCVQFLFFHETQNKIQKKMTGAAGTPSTGTVRSILAYVCMYVVLVVCRGHE